MTTELKLGEVDDSMLADVEQMATAMLNARWAYMPIPTDAKFLVIVCRELLRRRQEERTKP